MIKRARLPGARWVFELKRAVKGSYKYVAAMIFQRLLDRVIEMIKTADVDVGPLMSHPPENSPETSNGAISNAASDSAVNRQRSLPSGGSFVSLANEDGDWLGKESRPTRLMRVFFNE